MKKIYIAGCGGMLGEAFHKQFGNDYELKCTDKDVNEPWLSLLDFRNFEAYRKDVMVFSPDYLFHLGAYTDLEWCERNVDDTVDTNAQSVEYAVRIANSLRIPLLYISTAGIFDGKKDLYTEYDEPNPLGVYARTKFAGEQYVVEHSLRYLICRAGWMMGGGPGKDKKFIEKLMKQLREGADTLYIVNDKDGTPTYTHDFARTVKRLIENKYRGTFNCVCTGLTSRLEIAHELLRITGNNDLVKIKEVDSDYFKETYFAERPASERLDTTKLLNTGMNRMRNWKIALKEYLIMYYGDEIKEKIFKRH